MRIGVFLSNIFWSSIPYDGLNLFKYLSSFFEVDLLAFENDIRLNKEFNSNEKFFFDKGAFTNESRLRVLKDWNDFYTISSDYSIILTNPKISNKFELMDENIFANIKKKMSCPIGVWDIGGSDILTYPDQFADYYFTKGDIWASWLKRMLNRTDGIFTTGSPHYDHYLHTDKMNYSFVMSKIDFFKKYSIPPESICVLVAPSNTKSHIAQYDENLPKLEALCNIAEKSGEKIKILVKTYPHDYVFYEKELKYSGVYHRKRYSKPQYQVIKDYFPNIEIIESQDHFSAMKFCDKLFNISGSHLAWETVFSDIVSFTSGFSNKEYYKSPKYFPDYVSYPDEIVNIEIDDIKQVFDLEDIKKPKLENFISKGFSFENIASKLMEIKL